MADDQESSAQIGMPGSPGDPGVPSDAEGYPDAGAPKAQSPKSEPDTKSQQALDESRQKAYFEQLEKGYYESASRGEKMMAQIQDALQAVMKTVNAPAPAPPQGVTAPPPPTEQQKGGLSEFVFNLLKFGALAAVAFGSRGRGFGHNAIYKSAIGSALRGYAEGRKDISDASMRLWEKNREVVNDANREQNANYRAILADSRLGLSQKMDLVNGLSRAFGDYRAFQASQRQDLTEMHKMLLDQEKLQRQKEEFELKNRDKIYSVLGKNQMTAQYLEWVNQKSGGKISLTQNSPVEEWRQVEKDHPELAFSEFLRFHEQEEIRRATEKARSEAQARKDVKEGKTEETPADPEAAKKAAGILEGLVQ